MRFESSGPVGRFIVCTVALLVVGPSSLTGQDTEAMTGWAADPPELAALVEQARNESELRVVFDRYRLDLAALQRRYPIEYSSARQTRYKHMKSCDYGNHLTTHVCNWDSLHACFPVTSS